MSYRQQPPFFNDYGGHRQMGDYMETQKKFMEMAIHKFQREFEEEEAKKRQLEEKKQKEQQELIEYLRKQNEELQKMIQSKNEKNDNTNLIQGALDPRTLDKKLPTKLLLDHAKTILNED